MFNSVTTNCADAQMLLTEKERLTQQKEADLHLLSCFARCGRSLLATTVVAPVSFVIRNLSYRTIHPFAINFFSFFILSFVSFRHNASYLFFGLDGRLIVSLISRDSLFVPPMAGFTNDFMQGLGNVWFPINWQLFPEYFFSVSVAGEFTNFALAYAIGASELFAGTFLLGRIIGVSRLTSIIAAWILPLMAFQFVGWPLIPNLFRFSPDCATTAVIITVTAALMLLVGVSSLRKAIILGALSFLGIAYIVIATPTSFILAAPQFAMFGSVSLIAAARRGQLNSRLGILVAIVSLCFMVGFAFFIYGLTAYTAAKVFPNLSIRPSDLSEVSLLLWNPIAPQFVTPERSFILLGLLGGISTVLRGSGRLRLAATAFVSTALIYLAVGIVHAYHPFWPGPAILYFENFLFPYHSIFAALICVNAVRMATSSARGWRRRISVRTSRVLGGTFGAVIAIVPWFYIHERQRAFEPTVPIYYTPHPQPTSPITAILKREIALKPGASFRGREATLTGRIFPPSTKVNQAELAGVVDFLAMFATGNSHTAAGLWQDSIPTLLEYNQLMTPAYFVFCRFFFTEPADQQWRNLVAMRRIDPRLLAAVGVRFVVTDAPLEGNARLRETLDVPVQEEMLARMGVRHSIKHFTLYLYELLQANLGNYSPTEVLVVRSASQMLEVLARPSTDLDSVVITAEDIEERLVPARLSYFVVNKGYFTVKATSPGWSVLLLPLEYSRCLHVRAKNPDAENIRLFRANFLLTGVLFKEHLDAEITYHTGPFSNSRCRLGDAHDMEEIKIGSAFENRPELAPDPIIHY
jgi:hypothetical protein